MKGKHQKLFLSLILSVTVSFSACDMIMISKDSSHSPDVVENPGENPGKNPGENPGGVELTEDERDALEKTGRYLKLTNMPSYTQVSNVYSVSVANSSAPVARLDKNKRVMIYREAAADGVAAKCTVYLPLVCNDNGDFLETGFFYTSFSIHVDALTKFIVDPSDLFVVSYSDGRGQADVSKLPSSAVKEAANLPCLTVYNLPASVSIYNFSKVFAHNQTGPTAFCADYSQIALSVADNRASAKIPLYYSSLNQSFTETGVFYVSFDINVDAETRYTITAEDRVKVTFINGNGYLDVQNIPDNPVPYLSVKGLPLNAAKHHISKINVYNSAGPVADCPDYKLVSVVKYADSASFLIPLSYLSDGSYFQDSGNFLVSFEINVDVDTRIVFNRADNLLLNFTDGSAEIDVKNYVKTVPDDVPNNPNSGIELTEAERDRLEKTGHYLKLTNMPPHAQAPNFFSVSVANSSSSIAKLNHSAIFIYRETDTCTVYLPLVYNDNNDFLETGYFYTSFSVHVDAVTKYVVDISDRFLVYYVYGRGQADVNDVHGLPSNSAPPPVSDELTPAGRDELETNGRYLKIFNLPPNTQVANVFSVSVANASSPVAKLDKNKPVRIFKENNSCSVYLPLVYNDDGDFTETGSFFTAFTVHVDAVTNYIVNISDRFLVPYVNGRGQADASNLPSNAAPPSFSNELTQVERDELEKNGHYLKLSNMPSNTQVTNIFSVSVANSSSSVGGLDKNKPVRLFRDEGACSAYLPLEDRNGNDFLETGSFFTAFTVHVDAFTKYVINISDQFTVAYTDGRGNVDVTKLPSKSVVVEEPRYLTVSNLPSSVSIYNFSNVFIRDQTSVVAKCADYSKIILTPSPDGKFVTAKIPLVYNSINQVFAETGAYFVLFDINVDADTRYTLKIDDKIKVNFNNGNGFLDVKNIQSVPVPYLVIKGLPKNSTKLQISDVNVYNLAGSVATCLIYNDIIVAIENSLSKFSIPLSSSNGGWFNDTGRFAVSFTVNVDVDTQIVYKREDNLILSFTSGNAEFDYNSFYGYFNASLTNKDDSDRPVVKSGSSFDINGTRCTVKSDTTVNNFTPASACVLYLYAFYFDSEIIFEFSTAVPVYNNARKGWYNGTKRALWKMIYLYGSNQFLFKTYAADNFPQFDNAVLSTSDYSQLTALKSAVTVKTIQGASNPDADSFTLDPGVYVVELKGAGGGSGRSSSGGSGGLIREIFTLKDKTSFTAFTGSGGGSAPDVTTSGTFGFITTSNSYTTNVNTVVSNQGHTFTTTVSSSTYVSSNNLVNAVSVTGISGSMYGGGGGGGGSGSFLYSSNTSTGNYLLIAGGGGGGSGRSYLTPGGGGGAGGSIGPGAGGGASGSMSQTSTVGTGNYSAPCGAGGSGGGKSGGSGGSASSANGGNALSVLSSNVTTSGGTGSPSYVAGHFDVSSKIPFLKYPQAGTYEKTGGNPDIPYITSTNKALTVRTTFTFSGNSGSGGSAPSTSYLSGPLSWFDANNAGGAGADSYPLNNVYVNGDYDSDNLPSIVIPIGASTNGHNGSNGGNNRNSTKGGGASSGASGSVTIHKIY